MEAVEDLQLACGSTKNPDPAVAIPTALAEVEFWRVAREELDGTKAAA